jgi:hypothetical protein
MKKIFVDLDNTLCTTIGVDYKNSTPKANRIERINKLYEKGNIITIYTARGSGSGIDYKNLTLHQLKSWGVKFHNLSVGEKPVYDLLIDDKALSDKEYFKD